MPFQHLVKFLDDKVANTARLRCLKSSPVRPLTVRGAGDTSPFFPNVTVMRLQQGSGPIPAVLTLVDLGRLDPTAVDPPDDRALQTLARTLETASLVVRTQLEQIEEADELVLWFIAPAGANTDPGWQALRQEALRDTSVCPKDGWLPGRDAEGWDEQIRRFLLGTFLAAPWELDTPVGTEGPREVDLVIAAGVDRSEFDSFRSVLLGDATSRKPVEGTAPDIVGTLRSPVADPADALWTWAASADSSQKDTQP